MEFQSTAEKTYHLREHLNRHQQTVGRNMDSRHAAGKDLEGNKEQVIENWKKGDLCYYGIQLSTIVSYSYAESQTYEK